MCDALLMLGGVSIDAGERVLKLIGSNDFFVVLDERGKELSSEGMAKLIGEAGDRGFRSIVFCIGGPFGHSPEVRECIVIVVVLRGRRQWLDRPRRKFL